MGIFVEPHNYGNSWIFYVIVPIIFFGIVAGLWLIVRGAIGLLGQARREGDDRRCASPGVITHELPKRARTLTPAISGAPFRKSSSSRHPGLYTGPASREILLRL